MINVKIGSNTLRLGSELESYFQSFRENIIGINQVFRSPYGEKRIIYADWTGSGRLYRPIERKISGVFGPYMANTHTESNITSSVMTLAYDHAKKMIKAHVGADEHDVILFEGFGMTAVINKLQRILGIKVPDQLKDKINLPENDRPVIFVTHMEHHSNHTSWLETLGDVVILDPDSKGMPNIDQLEDLLKKYRNRKAKIGSFSACSNVTGIQLPYYKYARKMHEYGGICLVDFAASAPYVEINMHPGDPIEKLDGIFFSPHKFLGGPGSSGVVVFDSRLYLNKVPDHPGGGTVLWTNPWGKHHYVPEVEAREDGGTPGILQGIKAALAIKLKEKMGVDYIINREKELVEILLASLKDIPTLHILEGNATERLGIVAFYVDGIHYNLIVKLLNDRFGYQLRGGCSCAGTYGHHLFHIDQAASKLITDQIDKGDLTTKPGWVRFSVHPTMTNDEVYGFIKAMRSIIRNIEEWKKDYIYDAKSNDYFYIDHKRADMNLLFRLDE
ncbi:selenocysteine lyase/cysteine desulfurase [Scopulibacillus darangshiensis]|uniref:Selenocysteine lyase/cysteine desulfurase n=1 Tax=Scopulibacillus darangshiensis TaxID=442528 RepID=A0A4R2P4L5_9BACL|nr:aminotransferase class V-fold PLP-dependent enzyme [Scopulibacillus darangshiensis]TCP29004.1 selenocysteine lyase/cysteine desulfurase [Scopulibacillus darangshiensis]